MNAEQLANDLYRENDVLTNERDELRRLLDEAEAVIDAVKVVRSIMAQEIARLERSAWPDRPSVAARLIAHRDAVALLDGIDGL